MVEAVTACGGGCNRNRQRSTRIDAAHRRLPAHAKVLQVEVAERACHSQLELTVTLRLDGEQGGGPLAARVLEADARLLDLLRMGLGLVQG